ncbi:MAG: YcnI family protein [Pseudomonadota bacterium]|nr:YcnI family protein [Pseudomonadota bacterium]
MAAAGGLLLAAPAFSHVSLETKSAPAGSAYKAVFQVGHGCEGSATTGISVQLPAGFEGARPYPKAGWTLAVKQGKLAQPRDSHGKPLTEDVGVVSWTAASRQAALPDAHADEFVLRGRLPDTAGPLWFKVLQTCESGRIDWRDIPLPGASAKDLKSPAVLLDVSAPARPLPNPAEAAPAPVTSASPASGSSQAHSVHQH